MILRVTTGLAVVVCRLWVFAIVVIALAVVASRCSAAFFGRGLDFKQLFGGKETPVAQQRFVHRAQLVDGQQLVADAAPALAPALAARQRHQADDALPHGIRETHLAQKRHGGFVEQAAVERGQREGVLGAGNVRAQCLLLLPAAALRHEAEQAAQGGVKEGAVLRVRGGQRLQFQLTQGFEAVALEVNLALGNRHITQLGPGLDVEHEQQAVHHAQAFEAEVAFVELVLAAVKALSGIGGLLAQLAGRFVAQQFDGFAQGVLEVFADAKGVFVGVFIEQFEQAGAFTGGQAASVQQRAGRLQRGGVLAVQDVGPVKAQRAVVGPLVAVKQQPVVQAQQQHVAWGGFGAEQRFGDDAGPGFAFQRGRHRFAGVVQRSELVVEQVFIFRAGLVSGHDGQLGRLQQGVLPLAAVLGEQAPERQGLAGHQLMQGGRLSQRGR